MIDLTKNEEKIKISNGLKNRWDNMSEDEYQERVEKAKKRWSKLTALEKKNYWGILKK